MGLSQDRRDIVIAELERVHALANEPGERAMIAACALVPAVFGEFRRAGNLQDRALWLYLHHPDRFNRAEEIRYSDQHYSGRQWTGFLGPRSLWPIIDEKRAVEFKSALKSIFEGF